MFFYISYKFLIVSILISMFYYISADDGYSSEPVAIPHIDPRDCSLAECFDPLTGTCKPGNCSPDPKNSTIGTWSDCFLSCPLTGENCRTVIDNHNNRESSDVSIFGETLPSTGSYCLLPDNKTRSGNDSCLPSAVTRIRKYCLQRNASSNWPDFRSTYLVNFRNDSIDSYYLRKELRFAMSWCDEGDAQACERLSNICTLTVKTDSFPCGPFLLTSSPRKLFYTSEDAKKFLASRDIPSKFTLLEKDHENNKLNFVFGKYSLKGTFESYSQWISPCSFFKNVRYGVNGDKTCWISAKDFLDLQVTFYVPYLSYIANDNKNKYLYPLPVLVKTENLDIEDTSKWILTSKFFAIDSVTGASVLLSHENSTISRAPDLEVVRYMKSLMIQVRAQERLERGKIFPPLIIIEYGELSQSDVEKNIEIPIEYKIVFKLSEEPSNLWIKIALGVCAGLALAYAMFTTFSHYRRNASSMPIVKTLSWFIVYYCGAIGTDFLIVTFSVCISAFAFYKGQTVLHILLPTENTEKIIKISAVVAFAAKTVEIVALLCKLRNINIFLIDWEIPRKISSPAACDSPHTSLRKSYVQRFPKESTNSQQTPSEIIAARRNRTPSKSSQNSTPSRHSVSRNLEALDQFSPNYIDVNFALDDQDISQNSQVSMWRMYIIANEWLKMKTMRRINILIQVLGTLFFLEIAGLKYWTLAIPSLKAKSEQMDFVRESFTLKFAVGALTYTLVYFIQWIISALYARYYRNRLHGFVDLCSVANISIFILSHEYYGYYIHGRSVHGFADTDLLSIINDLKREEDNLCAHRGLIPGTTDQTFIVCVSKTFKSFYDSVAVKDTHQRKFSRKHIMGITSWEERWKTHLTIKKFLCGFLDHCFKNVEYTVKEKHLLEKLFNVEFMDNSSEKSTFYIDKHHSFDQAIFYGNEWTLATFEVSVFVVTIAFGGSYILSGVLTIFISLTVKFLAKFDMNRLFANKTLIDERFLMS